MMSSSAEQQQLLQRNTSAARTRHGQVQGDVSTNFGPLDKGVVASSARQPHVLPVRTHRGMVPAGQERAPVQKRDRVDRDLPFQGSSGQHAGDDGAVRVLAAHPFTTHTLEGRTSEPQGQPVAESLDPIAPVTVSRLFEAPAWATIRDINSTQGQRQLRERLQLLQLVRKQRRRK